MTVGAEEKVLRRAEFDADAIIKYHWMGLILASLLIVTIPFTIIAAIIYKIILTRVINSWDCVLMTRSLNVKKGIFNRIEKTVPLEKITDLQMVQGPIMRRFDLHRISVETAGQSGPGSLISLIGIKNTEAFRKEVLEQRDRMSNASGHPTPTDEGDALTQIRDSMARMERLVEKLVQQRDA
jgi:putative membrane protein